MLKYLLVASAFIGWLQNCAQPLLLSSPMLGHTDMKEVNILLQPSDICDYEIVFFEENKEQVKRSAKGHFTDNVFFTEWVNLNELEPGVKYKYEVLLKSKDGKARRFPLVDSAFYAFYTEELWQFRKDPPKFTFAMGSCVFINEQVYDRPGKPYGSHYEIFNTIADKKPDMMLWLGDNVYYREVDFEGMSTMIRRNQLTRSLPEMQSLLHQCPHYAIWDDHDFGPNDSNGSFIHKNWASTIFREFWGNHAYTRNEQEVSGQTAFSDVEFFFLDNRWNRTLSNVVGLEATILGEEQMKWFKLALISSKATFKFIAIGGQFLNTEAKFENYSTYAKERQEIIDFIEKNNIKNVVFLTGDRHCTELSELKLSNGNSIYDLTVSPLTSGAYDNTEEKNTLRVPNTLVPEHNFATIEISGKRKERVMTMRVFDSAGKLKWDKEIKE